jgi:UDP-N-acetylglucosamine/UDP-N-acetylgalactosamine diphosphorylase
LHDPTPDASALSARLERLGQHHIARLLCDATPSERSRLCAALAGSPLESICEATACAADPGADALEADRLEPPEILVEPAPGHASAAHARAVGVGEDALRHGKVGVVVVAGGMGTRLGWQGPKGTFPIGPVTGRSLFQLFAEHIRALSARFGRPLPWAIQTSGANHDQTRAFFAEHDHFGIAPEELRLFQQGDLPALDKDGRLIVGDDGAIVALPDGHGGVFRAMLRTGTLEWFRQAGVEHLFYFQVDNPLCRIADPAFLGHHILGQSDMSTKVVRKIDPAERVGLLARRDGVLQVIEYTELPLALAYAMDAQGALLLRAANTGIHAFRLDFAARMGVECTLPLHVASKPIPVGLPSDPEGHMEDGFKLEYFVFDALVLARAPLVYEVSRAVEFAPVKSADGADTPEAARAALTRQVRELAHLAGISELPADVPLELSPLVASTASELARCGPAAIVRG